VVPVVAFEEVVEVVEVVEVGAVVVVAVVVLVRVIVVVVVVVVLLVGVILVVVVVTVVVMVVAIAKSEVVVPVEFSRKSGRKETMKKKKRFISVLVAVRPTIRTMFRVRVAVVPQPQPVREERCLARGGPPPKPRQEGERDRLYHRGRLIQ